MNTKLLDHIFYLCHSGKCIANFLSQKLEGTEKVVVVSEEINRGNYGIVVQPAHLVTTDEKIVIAKRFR